MLARAWRVVMSIGVACALVVAAAAPSPAATTEPRRPRYLVIGDSLTWESAEYLRFFGAAAGADVVVLSFGGTALCDWFHYMAPAVTYFDPDAVALAFSGNTTTPCMLGADGAPLEPHVVVQRYEFHMSIAMWLLSSGGASIHWVATPPSADPSPVHRGVTELYAAAPAHWSQAVFVDGGASITPGGRWASTLPCLPFEPCTGPVVDGVASNVVRSPDGAHFCPADRPPEVARDAPCPVYSSGALRYALTILGSLVTRR